MAAPLNTPHNFIRNCAHLVGEAILVPTILLRGDGHGTGRVSDVLSYGVPVGIADLQETCLRGGRARKQKMLTQKSMSRWPPPPTWYVTVIWNKTGEFVKSRCESEGRILDH